MLIEGGNTGQGEVYRGTKSGSGDEIELVEGDVKKLIINDLDKSPVSQVFVNKELQQVEYEVLPTIYFSCEKYGHTKEMCPLPTVITTKKKHNGGDTNMGLRVVENIAKDLLQYQIKSGRNNGKGNGLGVAGCKMLNSLAVQFAALDNHPYVYKTNLVLVPSDLEDSKQLGNCSNDSSSFSSFAIESPVITTHINPTFEKSEETLVVLDETLLDPMRHSVVIFKENSNHNESEGSSEGRPNGTGKGVLNSKIYIPSDKSVSNQNAKRFNSTIRNRRDRFQLVGSTRALVSNIMNSIVKLIPLN
ncbi:hypothetical protein Godav_020972 [Gossypium davidsonii]|uniref:Zinc knuckle CX2CX4HX4C domain-containing protein n=1 Tax=Gossypium davidsonii TaxID=34287 RepID=A0A7J8R4M7_GOSDV|nr:hypothetical protein [Gossypium davidsonii]